MSTPAFARATLTNSGLFVEMFDPATSFFAFDPPHNIGRCPACHVLRRLQYGNFDSVFAAGYINVITEVISVSTHVIFDGIERRGVF